MPAENRVGCEQCTDLFKHFPTEELAFDDQSAPLVVVQEEALLDSYTKGEINGVNIERLIQEDIGLSPKEARRIMKED